MKKKSLRVIVAALAVAVIAGVLSGCSNGDNSNESNNSGDGTLKGSITAAGSTALQPLAAAAAEIFMEKYPKTQINVQGGGSGTGLSQVSSGAVQIGNSDLLIEDKVDDPEIINQLVDHKVAVIGFAMVANENITVDSLTKEQIQDIFKGKITNWKEVGGQDLKIEIINRGASSGTRTTFLNTIMDGESEAEGLGTVQDSSGAVQKSIQATEGSLSYLSLSYFISEEAKQGVKLLKINDIEPTYENISEGNYPFWSYEHMYTKGESKGLTKAFLDYMISEEVGEVIRNKGYLPAKEMKG